MVSGGCQTNYSATFGKKKKVDKCFSIGCSRYTQYFSWGDCGDMSHKFSLPVPACVLTRRRFSKFDLWKCFRPNVFLISGLSLFEICHPIWTQTSIHQLILSIIFQSTYITLYRYTQSWKKNGLFTNHKAFSCLIFNLDVGELCFSWCF